MPPQSATERSSPKDALPEPQSLGGTAMRDLSFGRLLMWALIVAAVVAGIVLFFRYGTRIAPALI